VKADLHVHSYHSGYNYDLPFLRSRDCYSLPEDVYRTAKARGMDLVTITDHDSIDGCLEFLDRHPGAADFIIGEEISCWLPTGAGAGAGARGRLEVHLGAYGMTERAHREIQPLRGNVFDVIAYLREARIFFALNHLFHFYRDQMPLASYLTLLDHVPVLETRNGAMLPAHNALIERIAGAAAGRYAAVAGSDAHTLRRVGRTWIEAPGNTREEFLANLAAGRGTAHGQQGGALPLAADIYGVIADYWLSLIGLRRHELSLPRRAFGITFSLVSAPFEFIPLLVATIAKSREARCIERCATALHEASAFETPAPNAPHATAPMKNTPLAPQAHATAPMKNAPLAPQAHATAPMKNTPLAPQAHATAPMKNTSLAPQAPSAAAPREGATPFIPSPRLRGEGSG
jgi:predicted metal-dependent phosphoesterase TrpH